MSITLVKKNLMSSFADTVKRLGPVKLGVMGLVFLSVVGFLAYMVARVSEPEMGLLFSGLDPNDASKMVNQLETTGIPYQLQASGTQIYVPRDRVARLRLEMAENGLPGSGVVGYEIFDRGDLLALTSGLMDINQLRATEGELTKSIQTIEGVAGARVHLVLPKKELFSEDKVQPSASILLNMRGNVRLKKNQIAAIRNLVSSAVPDLNPMRISIVDNQGNLLARSMSDDQELDEASNHEERRASFEKKMTKTIEQMLEKSLGYGKVRATVSAEMAFDRVSQNSITYDPSGRVARSTSNVEEDNASTETSTSTNITVENNLPNEGQEANMGKNSNKNRRVEENVTYELSSTSTNTIREVGTLKRLSVGVIIDGTYTKDAEGNPVYKPRSAEEIDTFVRIVKTAMGYQVDRGDIVEVVNIPFNNETIVSDLPMAQEKSMLDMILNGKTIEVFLLSMVGLVLGLFVLRPVLLRLLDDESDSQSSQQLSMLGNNNGSQKNTLITQGGVGANGQPIIQQITNEQGSPGMISHNLEQSREQMDENSAIKINNVSGTVSMKKVKSVDQIIDSQPEEAVQLLRGWMYSR
jgi:flagellar M-ring protein FliF